MSVQRRDWLQTLFVIVLHVYIVRSTSTEYADYCRRGTGLVRHPSRCDAFVECASNGHAVERFCGPTLYFNADKGVCDYQHLVKCQLLNNDDQLGQHQGAPRPSPGGGQSYQETVYGQQSTRDEYNGAPPSSQGTASDIQAYCQRALEEAKATTHQRLMQESSLSGPQSTASGPYSFVSNFLHTQPYAKTLTYSAMSCTSAIKLIQQRYDMSGSQVMKLLNEIGMHNTLLKPMPGQHRPDTEMPVSPDYDYCPYPSNYVCQRDETFRTQDGSCNNNENSLLGRSMTPYRRLLPAKYADDGKKMQEVQCGNDGCTVSDDPLDPCLPIAIPDDDYDFAANRCLKFVRSMPVPLLNCHIGNREQLNQVTHWLDGSQVYGSTKKESDAIRDLSQPNRGRLAVHETRDPHSKPLLPQDAEAAVCNGRNASVECFKAGDGRVNENSGITTFHTVFVRQHNLLEEGLHYINPRWDGERLYQETRRIVSAMLQHVAYNELLPLLLGQQVIQEYQLGLQKDGYFNGYDASIDSRIPNEFATAAFRYGHTLLQERLFRIDGRGQVNYELWLSQTFNSPAYVYDKYGGGVDGFIRGLVYMTSQPFDWFFTKQITRSLFTGNPPTGVGHDLTSINIQRGRDHGIATYNDYREWCGLRRARNFEDLASEIDADFVQEIQRVYRNVDDIDLYAGGVSERSVKGGIVGPTFACIIASTFRNLRLGDRYWYENKQAGFTPDQLQEIRKVRMARIMCLNSDSVSEIQPYVFLQPSSSSYPGNEASQFNSPVPCDSLPDLQLQAWKEAGY